MRILVTGANGLVGSRLCDQLARDGHEVIGASRGERRASGSWRYVRCELTAEGEVARTVEDAAPEVIINPASMTEVDLCEKEPEKAYAANVLAPALLAGQARRRGAHLLHVSTDYVFDGEKGGYTEEDVPNPRGAYAVTKHMGEQAVRTLAPSWAIARTAVVYGWPPAGRPNFGAWLVGALEKQQPVKLFEDQLVSPSLADNVAQMLAELGTRKLPGIWNTSGAEIVDRVTFGRKLCSVFGFDPALLVPTRLKDLNLPSPRPLRSGLDTSKTGEALAAKPLGLDASLERFHAAYRAARAAA